MKKILAALYSLFFIRGLTFWAKNPKGYVPPGPQGSAARIALTALGLVVAPLTAIPIAFAGVTLIVLEKISPSKFGLYRFLFGVQIGIFQISSRFMNEEEMVRAKDYYEQIVKPLRGKGSASPVEKLHSLEFA